jgi:hypothetical protein
VPDAYLFFLDFLLDRTADKEEATGKPVWKWENDPVWFEKLKPMAQVEKEREAAKRAGGNGALHLKTQMGEIGKVHLQNNKKEKKEAKKEKRASKLKSVAKKVRRQNHA